MNKDINPNKFGRKIPRPNFNSPSLVPNLLTTNVVMFIKMKITIVGKYKLKQFFMHFSSNLWCFIARVSNDLIIESHSML